MNLKHIVFLVTSLFSLNSYAHDISAHVATLGPMLNSERIAYLFGSYGIDVLEGCPAVLPQSRVSNLYSTHNNIKIMRTLAMVNFEKEINPALLTAHQKIQAGASLGSTLKEMGWKVIKEPVYLGEIDLSPSVMQYMQETSKTKAAIHIYELKVSHANTPQQIIPYCTIIEVHSPQYINLQNLTMLYPESSKKIKIERNIQDVLNQVKDCQSTIH